MQEGILKVFPPVFPFFSSIFSFFSIHVMLVIVSQDLRIPLDRMAGAEDFAWHSVARDGPSQWSPSATVLCRWGQRQQQSSFSVSAEGPKLGSNAQEHDGTRHCLEKRRSNEQPRYWGCRCTVKNHDLRLLTVIWLYLMNSYDMSAHLHIYIIYE